MISLSMINEYMSKLRDWSLEESAIVKNYRFPNFKRAMEFLNEVAEVSERMNHHPDITLSYNLLRLRLTTHSEKGLTSKDFEAAIEIDKLKDY